jgi:hypothetical protein
MGVPVEARLESVRKRVVEELKRELHKFDTGAVPGREHRCARDGADELRSHVRAWLSLKGLMASVGAYFLMAILFLLVSLVPLAMLLSLKARGKRAHQESRGGGRQVEAHP